MKKDWPTILYSIYLLLVCFVSGMVVLFNLGDSAQELIKLLMPELYPEPRYEGALAPQLVAKRELLENSINLVICIAVFAVHWCLFKKVRKAQS